MRMLISLLMLSGIALTSGCVVVPAQQAGIGFYGPFPAVYVEGHRGDSDRRYYDDRGHDHRYHDDDGRHDGRYHRDHDD